MPPGAGRRRGGPNWLLIAGIVVGVVVLFGFGGCAVCLVLASSGDAPVAEAPPAQTEATPTPEPAEPEQNWITAERPYVKFLKPPGWNMVESGDWGVFKSPDNEGVLAFTMYNRPFESTAKLGHAARVLGVNTIVWVPKQKHGTVGKNDYPARIGEGSCNYNGSGGYVWYATVDPGSTDKILIMYAVSARGTASHKEAALVAINSIQRR